MVADHLHPDTPNAPRTVARSDGTTGDGRAPEFRCVVDAVPLDPQGRTTIVILRMAGEIDLLTQHAVEGALRSGLHAGGRHLLVDLSAVTFCGARGLATLADTASTAAGRRLGYAVSGLSPHLDRTAAMLWSPDGPTRYRSLAVAVTTIRAGHARRS